MLSPLPSPRKDQALNRARSRSTHFIQCGNRLRGKRDVDANMFGRILLWRTTGANLMRAIPTVYDGNKALRIALHFTAGHGAGFGKAIRTTNQFGAIKSVIGVNEVIVHDRVSLLGEGGKSGLGLRTDGESSFAGCAEDIAKRLVGFDPASGIGGHLAEDSGDSIRVLFRGNAGEEATNVSCPDFGGISDLLFGAVGDFGKVGHVVISAADDISIHTENMLVNGFICARKLFSNPLIEGDD